MFFISCFVARGNNTLTHSITLVLREHLVDREHLFLVVFSVGERIRSYKATLQSYFIAKFAKKKKRDSPTQYPWKIGTIYREYLIFTGR